MNKFFHFLFVKIFPEKTGEVQKTEIKSQLSGAADIKD